jgi:ABC-type transport system involved in multi-copper enzyme maturation permease subunit
MMARLVQSEWMRGRGRPVEKFTGALVIVASVLIPLVMIGASSRNPLMRASALDTLSFPLSVSAARTMAMLIGPLWAAAIGANVVGAEYQYGTWPLLLVRCPNRIRLALAKMAAAMARIAVLTVLGVLIFVAAGAAIRMVSGAPVSSTTTTLGQLIIPFVVVAGAMAFAAVVGFTITIVSQSVAFGTSIGALAFPLLSAIRFKETAAWIPYVHLENLQSHLFTGKASPVLVQLYAFDMSARASAAIVSLELAVILAVGVAVLRRQELVY